MTSTVLRAENVVKQFRVGRRLSAGGRGVVSAVDGIDLELRPGETLGVVGESGSGKSTLAEMLVGLERPTSGAIYLGDQPLHSMRGRRLRQAMRDIQLVHQDPYTSLNPRMTVEALVREPLDVHRGLVPRKDVRTRVLELLDMVGLDPDQSHRYTHQFSGGQRQRIGIARALALQPRVLVCDEPVSALDVSVQAQIINLLAQLQEELGIAYVFISHDLSVVQHIADRVAVMYLGKVVEQGSHEQVYDRPQHPYTNALLRAIPSTDRGTRGVDRGRALAGEPPSPMSPPAGCHFHPRCPRAHEDCSHERPSLVRHTTDDIGHLAACHYALEETG